MCGAGGRLPLRRDGETGTAPGMTDPAAFVRDNTELLAPPLVPEIRLHLAHEALPLWEKTEEELGAMGLPPPYWAFAWAGGQALARFLLDRPETVAGATVLDFASGSGLVGIAAAQAGAARVLCAEIDDFALAAIALNAAANAVALDSARGEFAEARPGFGLRVNWEFGRLFALDPFSDALFADLTWLYGRLQDGTERVFGVSRYHYFSLAPAWEVHVDRARAYGFYAQLGGGLGYQHALINSDGQETSIAGIKPLFQYGVGFRARPQIGDGLRLVFRAELTRFRRGYMNDTLIAASVGAGF